MNYRNDREINVPPRPSMSLPEPRRPASGPHIGFLRRGQVEGAFVILLYIVLWLLVVLSVLGTFYGRLGASAPLEQPAQILADVRAVPTTLLMALLIQAVLTILQYGARQKARRDRRWWILYLAALSVSVYYNFQAYWAPLSTMFPAYVAALLILAGDVLPEYLAVRHD